ncbi:MotA/TolQ/ExbB proton channel family protein [Chitinivorax sp. B]|uniref:MotA/TolQ/ExbB proton channel family protein n=1 Tax=Chitinivorax sp. B TaxID=2502235 RepID=UPI0010F5C4B2|nr:MotA/TolQ/ExbB proton channel family protein [Chitinivorax sp. B]
MLSIIQAAGWPIYPLILASIAAVTIIIERMLSLRADVVAPKGLLNKVVQEYRSGGVTQDMLNKLSHSSHLGRIFAAGLRNVNSSRDVMKESIEEAGSAVSHDLGRFLTTLGSIASLSPLLGLLGTVVGMIEIFGSQAPTGNNPAQLAHGISIALYNTAFGIIIAVPAIGFYRHLRSKIDSLTVEMEQQAIKLVEVVHGERKL